MPELLIKNLDEKITPLLERLAKMNCVSNEKEDLDLSNNAIENRNLLDHFINTTNSFAASLPPQTTDSVDLIREDRDRFGII
jgi:hypothetical protein